MPIRTDRPSRVRLLAWVLVSPTASAASVSVRSGRRIARSALRDDLGLRLGQVQSVQDQGLVVLKLGEQCHPDRGPDSLLGHGVAVIAVAAGEGGAATLALVGSLGADTGVAGPLLAEQFLARAGDVGSAAGVDRADPAGRQVHQHHVVQQLLVDRTAKIGRVDRLLAHLLAGGIENRNGQHDREPIKEWTAGFGLQPWPRWWSSLQLNLVRLADGQVAAGRARDGSSEQEQVVGRVDLDHFEVADRGPGVAVMAGFADPLLGPRRIGAGAR